MKKALTTPDIAAGHCGASQNPPTTGAGLVFSHPVVKELMTRVGLGAICDNQGLFGLHWKTVASRNTAANAYEFIALCRRMLRRELCRERGVTEEALSLAEVDRLCRELAEYEKLLVGS